MSSSTPCLISAYNEWDPLEEVIVGVAEHSMFPSEDRRMMERTLPSKYIDEFRMNNPFPKEIVENACKELDNFAKVLESFGVVVRRPTVVDWSDPKTRGYTGSMVRDSLLPIGNKLVEAPTVWKCRDNEHLAYESLFKMYSSAPGCTVVRRPYRSLLENMIDGGEHYKDFIINNNRPAFDAADFIRVGKNTLLGQMSNVTNAKGVQYIRDNLKGTGIELQLVEVTDPHALHIDATALPLKEGLMVYHGARVPVERLREIPALKGWTLEPRPEGQTRTYPPWYMTSNQINMNVLSLDGKHVFIETDDDGMAEMLLKHDMIPIRIPFKHVNCLGGSFHCATVDIRRRPGPPLQRKSSGPLERVSRFVCDTLCKGDRGVRLEEESDDVDEKRGW